MESQVFATAKKLKECKDSLDLLEHGFISTTDELTKLAETWQDNSIMRAAIREYAKKHEWTGFAFVDKFDSVREFGSSFFSHAERACGAPLGYDGFWMESRQDSKACVDLARAYEVSTEYWKGYNGSY